MVSDNGGLSHDNTRSMIDTEIFSDLRPGMNVDPGCECAISVMIRGSTGTPSSNNS